MFNDFRYATRTLLRTPGFTIVAVLTLALGIGANTAIFQLIDAVALRPLPIPHPEALVEVRIVGTSRGFGVTNGRYAELTRPIWEQLKQDQQALDGLFAWRPADIRIGERSNLRRADGIEVSGDFFSTLGVTPYLGRLLAMADETSACPASVAVVSYDYWRNEMGGRPLGPGAMLRVNMDPVEVVGVTPPGFTGLAVGESFDIALPLCRAKEVRREVFDIAVLGRLRQGWTIERASAHLDAISAGIFEATAPAGYSARSIETFKAFRLGAYTAATGVSTLRTEYETALRLLFAFTAVILLIACANLANLLLARAASRDREVAVRVAIGASRMALIRPLVIESCLVAAAGALMAVGLSQVLGRVLLFAITTGQRGPTLALATDWRMLLFAVFAAFVTCVFFGAGPALRAARIDPIGAMRSGGRGTTLGHDRLLLQRMLVAAQITMAVVMLVGALLFVQTFRNLMTVDTGMRHAGVSVAFVRFPDSVTKERFDDFRRELLDAITSVPGIVSAGSTSNTPLIGGSWTHGIRVGDVKNSAQFTWVSPGYFDTMGIPILQGRDITLQDTRDSPRVAVVNRTFMQRFTGNANPIGRTLQTSPEPGYPATVYEIVGVIPDTHYNSLRGGERRAMIFAPDTQHPSPNPGGAIMIHSSVPPEVATERVRSRIAERYPMALVEFTILESRLRDSLVRERLLAMLAGFFGVLATALTVVGLYGMLSYAVAQRRQEFGVRLALGAGRAHVLSMVMRDAGKLLAAGIVGGLLAALVVGRTVTSLLFGVTPGDPLMLIGACVLLCVTAAAASYLPARRASRVDPIVALRYE
jgi:predicted permease